MPSRIPEPMPDEMLRHYRWQQCLPVLNNTGNGIPYLAMVGGPIPVYMGKSTSAHVFAEAVIGNAPKLSQYVWGYSLNKNNIEYLGPVLIAQENVPVKITWINKLPTHHPFVHPMPDLAAPGSVMAGRYSVGHAAVHMHGARVAEGCDGYPMRKTNIDPQQPSLTVMRSGESVEYEYPNEQPGGATLWYHDHAMDMTAMNVYAGLAAGYVLRHKHEGTLSNIPCATGLRSTNEIPLIIQDKSFLKEKVQVGVGDGKKEDRCLLYGDVRYLNDRIKNKDDRAYIRDPNKLVPPSPEFKGHAICVNGKLWPTLEVKPCVYRFRVFNGANSRIFVLRLSSSAMPIDEEANLGVGGQAASIYQIGSDGGIFQRAVELSGQLNAIGQPTTENFLVLAPGERADVLVDFSTVAGKTVFLTNHATNDSPLGNGGDSVSDPNNDPMYNSNLSHVLKFKVNVQPQGEAVPKLNTKALNADLETLKPANQPVNILNAERRRYVLEEFPVPFTNDINSRQWKAITIRAVGKEEFLPLAHQPGMLWGGQMPDVDRTELQSDGTTQYILKPSGVPNGGPASDPNDLPTAKVGDVEIWEIYNISPDVHPIHLHLVNFLVMSREPIMVDGDNNIVPDTAPRSTPSKVDANENLGWKDTVRANPKEKITLLVNFGGGSPQGKDYSGEFVWHCHLIEHEDMGMMRPLKVENKQGELK